MLHNQQQSSSDSGSERNSKMSKEAALHQQNEAELRAKIAAEQNLETNSSSSTNEEAKVIAYQEETVVKEAENGTDRPDLKPPAEELDPSQNQEA